MAAQKGLDFLGYHLTLGALSVAVGTIDHHIEHIDRLYEQGASPCCIRQYIRRRWAWVASNLDCFNKKHALQSQFAESALA